jgi:hypothetical protein
LSASATKPHHHALVGFARMACQGQRMVGVVAVIDVRRRQIGLEDSGFEGHASSGLLRYLVAKTDQSAPEWCHFDQ